MSSKHAVLPSGRAGVYRASDGKRWDAYVLDTDLILLGTYPSIRAADAARDKYWQAKKGKVDRRPVRNSRKAV
jgi:hypothetical protein